MAQSYSWIVGSGAWATPSNWADLTTSTSPSTTAPGEPDTATIQGPTTNISDLISGPGSADSLTLLGNVALTGTFSAASATFGTGDGGTVNILAGAVVGTESLTADSQDISINGAGAQLIDSGDFSGQGFAEIMVSGGGFLQTAQLALTFGEIGVDPAGTVEIGTAGGAPAGTISVDAGATVQASANFVAPVLLNGLINGGGGQFDAAVSGSGTIEVAASARFTGPVAAGVNVVFTSATADLTVSAPASFGATIAGFQPGDLIAVNAPGVTGLSYAGNASGGTLALLGGTTTLESLLLAGSYDPASFLLLPFGGAFANANIAVATNPTTTPTAAPAGPGNSDAYSWGTFTGGDWDSAANWGGLAPPGSSNPVTIASAVYGYQIINGDGNSASILFTGEGALNGVFNTGTLILHETTELTPSTLALLPGSVLNTVTADVSSGFDIGGATLAVSGTLGFGDTSYGSGSMFIYGGGFVRAAALTLGISSSYATVSIDPTSTMEIGSTGGAAAGAMTVDAGSTADLAGEVDGNVVNNGLIDAEVTEFGIPSVLNGAIDDAGTIAMQAGAHLSVEANVTGGGAIDFAPGSTLSLQLPGTIDALLGGFAVGDAIGTGSAEVAGAAYAAMTGSLVLSNASSSPLLTLDMGGSFTGDTFLALASADQYDELSNSVVLAAGTVQSGTPPAPPPGTAGADDYTWTATGGAWGDAANWADVTAGQTVAAFAPGSLDLVTIPDMAISGGWQVISGAGDAATLTVLGNVALSGAFTAQSLVVTAGTAVGGNSGIGSLDVLAGATLSAAAATVTGVLLANGAGALVDISGVLTLNGAASATGQADLVTAGLTSTTSAAIYVDSSATMEIGAAGGAAAGALNIDAGVTASAHALSLAGNLVNNGTLAVADGLTLPGNVTGDGVIALQGGYSSLSGNIGAGQTVSLSGTDNLSLSASALPTITGFAPGDAITFGQEVTGVSWSAGVLTLTNDGTPVEQIPLAGNYAAATFIVTPQVYIPGALKEAALPAGYGAGNSMLTLVPCFATGTRIATADGQVPVERLRTGDRVLSAFAGGTAVRWIGHRTLDCSRHPRPAEILPVRVRAGAFGPAMPRADLLLSPDHAVYVEGALVPVRYLINGASVAQQAAALITYWHVELPAHDVIFAEGLPAESYLDTGNRSALDEESGARSVRARNFTR